MAEFEKELFSNEKMLHQAKRHWIASLLPAVFGAFLFASGLLMGKLRLQIGEDEERSGALLMPVLYLIVSLLLFGLAVRLRASPQLAITNLRVIVIVGLIYSRALTMPITAIEDVRMEQGVFGKMLGYSKITIQRQHHPPLVLWQIQGGDQFRREVLLSKYELARPVKISQGSLGIMRPTP